MHLEARDTLMTYHVLKVVINVAKGIGRVRQLASLNSGLLLKLNWKGRECHLAGIACQFLTVDVVAVIATRMAPLCQMIERLQSRVKAKQEGDVKKEDGPLTPSPAKKLATDMEKKLKNVTGDTRLVKESQCTLEQVLC